MSRDDPASPPRLGRNRDPEPTFARDASGRSDPTDPTIPVHQQEHRRDRDDQKQPQRPELGERLHVEAVSVSDALVDRTVLPPGEPIASRAASEQRVLRRFVHRRSPVLDAIARRRRRRAKRQEHERSHEQDAGNDREPTAAQQPGPVRERPTADEGDERDGRERGSVRFPPLHERPRGPSDCERGNHSRREGPPRGR